MMMARQRLAHPGALTPAETDAFRSVVSRPRDLVAVSLMLDAGLRASEVVGLRLEDIDWGTQTLRFVGKGGKSAELPISSRLRDEVERAIQARPPQATHPYLLYDLRDPGKPISRFALLKMVKGYGRKAGLTKRLFCHLLRHTFGTNVFRETGDLGRTQAVMRHTKIATTTVYMHLTAEDQRPTLEGIDRRPWLWRWWSRLRPLVVPDGLRPRSAPLLIGETVGRHEELTRLRKGIRQGMHTVLVGERGVGRRHLLRVGMADLTPGPSPARRGEQGGAVPRGKEGDSAVPRGEQEGDGAEPRGAQGESETRPYLHLEAFSPARECLVRLCERLKAMGYLESVPVGRSDTVFIEAIRRVGREQPMTLFIDSISDLTKKERQNLRKVAETWTVVTTLDRRQIGTLGLVFFGHYQRIDVEPFDRATGLVFARRAMGTLRIADERAYLTHVYAQAQGNAQAMLELIDATRKTGDRTPLHAGVQRVLPASVFLALFAMVGVMARYSAATLSEPALRLYAIAFVLTVAALVTVDKVLSAKAR